MADNFLNALFDDAAIGIKNPHTEAAFVTLDNIGSPLALQIGYDSSKKRVRWEDFPIGARKPIRSLTGSFQTADSQVAGINLAIPGSGANVDTAAPLFVGLQITVAFDARDAKTLTITIPYAELTSNGETTFNEEGEEVTLWNVNFEAMKKDSSTAVASLAVA